MFNRFPRKPCPIFLSGSPYGESVPYSRPPLEGVLEGARLCLRERVFRYILQLNNITAYFHRFVSHVPGLGCHPKRYPQWNARIPFGAGRHNQFTTLSTVVGPKDLGLSTSD
jgi:hypothetical protein